MAALLDGLRKVDYLKERQRPGKSLIVTGLVQKRDNFVLKTVLLEGE
jgi:hypothetical protein